jgi:cytochrome P450 family 3 subfamily A
VWKGFVFLIIVIIDQLLSRIDRKVIDDITILGHKFPKGALAVIPVYALHHDPDLWTDPETFDPER